MADQKLTLYKGEVEIVFKEDSHRYYRLDKENLTKAGTPRKKSVCGVTTILGIINKPALINWAVSITIDYIKNNLNKIDQEPAKLLADAKAEAERVKRESADIGKEIHAWIELHIKGETPEIPVEENIKRGVISFLDWESQHKVEYLESEKIVYSKQYNYIGTLDITAKIDGKIYLLDLKTGNAIWQEHHAQVAAYMMADIEERGTPYEGRIILRISKETKDEYEERVKDKGWFQKNPEKYPYQVFEAIYLDEDGSTAHQDFEAFKSALKIYRWKK